MFTILDTKIDTKLVANLLLFCIFAKTFKHYHLW